MKNKTERFYYGEKPPKPDNSVLLITAVFFFLGNKQLTSRYLVTRTAMTAEGSITPQAACERGQRRLRRALPHTRAAGAALSSPYPAQPQDLPQCGAEQ